MRHGESVYNVRGLCNDDPARPVNLTDAGRRQAADAAGRLRDAPFAHILISELPRARETAEIVNRHHRVPITADPRLNDIRTGFDGRPVAAYFAAMGPDRLDGVPPGGESLRQYQHRVGGFLDWLERQAWAGVLVVAHEETLRVVIARYRGLDEDAMAGLEIGNCEAVRFDLPATGGG